MAYIPARDLDREIVAYFRTQFSLARVSTTHRRELIEAYEIVLDPTSLHIVKIRKNLTPVFPVGSLVLVLYLTRPTSKLRTRKAGLLVVMSRAINNVGFHNLTSITMDVPSLTISLAPGRFPRTKQKLLQTAENLSSPAHSEFWGAQRYESNSLFSFKGLMEKQLGGPGNYLRSKS